jgi:vancomycin resistance protein YoaR
MNSTHQHRLFSHHKFKLWHTVLIVLVGVCIFVVLLLSILRLTYQGRFMPGVKIYGVYVGGLTKDEATTLLKKETAQYIDSSTIIIDAQSSNTKAMIPASEVGLTYDIQSDVDAAYQQGRDGQLLQKFFTQAQLLVGLNNSQPAHVNYNPTKLYAIIQPISKSLATPSQNASLTATPHGMLAIQDEQAGNRLNLVNFIDSYTKTVSLLQRNNITAQVNSQLAAISSNALQINKNNLEQFVHNPMSMTYKEKSWTIPTNDLLSWLSYTSGITPLREDILHNYYHQQPPSNTQLGFDTSRIKSYISTTTKEINQKAIDAKLTIENGRATIFQQSQDGRAVDLDITAKAIVDNILASSPTNTIPLTVVVTKADVTSDTIEQLGIKELLSEGVSYFPGSSANRMTNVRVGANRYNGVLLKPGQVFSFGELLGKVGPEQGYKEGRVILEGRTESQYGGGLCQVSSTAFRAALLAGLPILERYNHSFAVDYYTQPYGVPGVDATIYYPSVDFKFRNDTANYILIQTEMVGTTLKFRFYGTKEKSGVIRGPYFISGSNDATQPSKTVFYRDIIVNEKVAKTTTFYTTYRSSLDFPPVN